MESETKQSGQAELEGPPEHVATIDEKIKEKTALVKAAAAATNLYEYLRARYPELSPREVKERFKDYVSLEEAIKLSGLPRENLYQLCGAPGFKKTVRFIIRDEKRWMSITDIRRHLENPEKNPEKAQKPKKTGRRGRPRKVEVRQVELAAQERPKKKPAWWPEIPQAPERFKWLLSMRFFIVNEDDHLERIGATRLRSIMSLRGSAEGMPQYAGKTVRLVIAVVGTGPSSKKSLLNIQCSFLSFDDQGNYKKSAPSENKIRSMMQMSNTYIRGESAAAVSKTLSKQYRRQWKLTLLIEREILSTVLLKHIYTLYDWLSYEQPERPDLLDERLKEFILPDSATKPVRALIESAGRSKMIAAVRTINYGDTIWWNILDLHNLLHKKKQKKRKRRVLRKRKPEPDSAAPFRGKRIYLQRRWSAK